MAATGLDVFDKTLQTTNVWLDELMQELGPQRGLAWHALGAVLRPLRDRLPMELAVHMGSQLPLLVRGLYYDQWHAAGKMDKVRDAETFLARVGQGLADTRQVNVRTATSAVFSLLSRHVSAGQIEKVRTALPEDIRRLWSTAAPGAATEKAVPGENI